MLKGTVTTSIALALLAGSAAAQSQSPDQQSAVETVQAFHQALARGDSLAALRLLAPDAVILEAGDLETRADYRSHHLPADIAFAQAVSSQQAEPTVVVSGNVAWVASTSRTTGTFRDRAINSAGAELVVLTRVEQGWLIRAIHWSSYPIRTP